MKTKIKNLFLLPALIAGLNLIPTGRVTAQTFTVLHTFNNSPDGANPRSGFILSGNTLYATTEAGGLYGYGTIFAINTDGSGYTNLYSFTGGAASGANPYDGVILSGNTLYGTTGIGGTYNGGTVFAISTNGTGYTNLYSFNGAISGNDPNAALVLLGNTLYGTASRGGTHNAGTVFAINTNGTGFTNLYSFAGGNDGILPLSALVLSGNTLYGTTGEGGSSDNGTVFAINTDGSGYTNLFSSFAGKFPVAPDGGVILSGNTLYGTTFGGGTFASGAVFALSTNGTGFTNLYSFSKPELPSGTNSDGASPEGGLILSSNTLYGTASGGGARDEGSVFAVNTNGTGFTNLHNFSPFAYNLPGYMGVLTNSDGIGPLYGLVLSGTTLYGTASSGGSSGNGTIFSINLAPLNIKTNVLAVSPLSGGIAQLTYLGTPGAKFALDWAHGLNMPIIWTPLATNTTTPDGYLIFTNTASGTNDFYRIRSVP